MPSCQDPLSWDKKDLIPLETLLYITCFIPETRTTVLIPKCIQTWSSSSCAWTFWWSVFLLSSPPTWSRLVQCNHFLVVSKLIWVLRRTPSLEPLVVWSTSSTPGCCPCSQRREYFIVGGGCSFLTWSCKSSGCCPSSSLSSSLMMSPPWCACC